MNKRKPSSEATSEGGQDSLSHRQQQQQQQQRRTQRACDRCRSKKAKCDGLWPCRTCTSKDRVCIYSLRRRRDARSWYCDMQEVLDAGIQRLYTACREGQGFPGTLPIEVNGYASTEAILQGMGLFMPGTNDDVPAATPKRSRRQQSPRSQAAEALDKDNDEIDEASEASSSEMSLAEDDSVVSAAVVGPSPSAGQTTQRRVPTGRANMKQAAARRRSVAESSSASLSMGDQFQQAVDSTARRPMPLRSATSYGREPPTMTDGRISATFDLPMQSERDAMMSGPHWGPSGGQGTHLGPINSYAQDQGMSWMSMSEMPQTLDMYQWSGMTNHSPSNQGSQGNRWTEQPDS